MAKLGLAAAAIALATAACGSQPSAKAVPITAAPSHDLRIPALTEADELIVARHRAEAVAIAAPGAAIDTNGLVGRNRSYGLMVSPRLQLGSGAALRVGLHADPRMAVDGFRAIEAGTAAIAPDGEVVSVEPPDAPRGARLSAGDKASGAAFFLADVCPAMLALRANDTADKVANAVRRARVEAALDRGLRWLVGQANALEAVDRMAPNRLLYDALAFHSCGVLTGNRAAQMLAVQFVGLALAQHRRDGVFVETGGSDTTYQAVSVRLAFDLLATGYAGPDAQSLKIAWQAGAIWLGGRILADGRIDSRGNTRTCAGGESFLGTEKKVWPPGVYAALVYPAEVMPDDGLKAAAARLSAWARANPRTDPCFP
jgi:hypothetical protein